LPKIVTVDYVIMSGRRSPVPCFVQIRCQRLLGK